MVWIEEEALESQEGMNLRDILRQDKPDIEDWVVWGIMKCLKFLA